MFTAPELRVAEGKDSKESQDNKPSPVSVAVDIFSFGVMLR